MVKNSIFFSNITSKVFYALMVTCVWALLISIWLYFDSGTTAEPWFKFARAKNFMFNDVNSFTNSRIPSQVTDENNRTFLILYWGFPWGIRSYGPPEGRPTWSRCEVTYNRSRIEKADLVIFHYTTIEDSEMPWKFYRNPKQVFVWWSAENPVLLRIENHYLKTFNNFFNWSWTYRRDSDVMRFYGYRGSVLAGMPRGKDAIDEEIRKKKKLAIWCVSRCSHTRGAKLRMKYSEELRKAGLNFEGCGECFPYGRQSPRGDPNMKKMIGEYKFYFAFENSLHCKDYITEKFWENSLGSGTVPIVWGPAKKDILEAAPLDSFIFAEDYETPEKLVKYIKYLDSNDTEYRKYFRWREDKNMTDEKMMGMIKSRYPDLDLIKRPKSICQTFIENKNKKVIKSLAKYFMEDNPKECI